MTQKHKEKSLSSIVLKRPHISEKATISGAENAYVFIVDPKANKLEVKKAIEEMYKVKPLKVHMVSVPKKTIFSRGKLGTKGGFKKAIVFLKKGSKIDIL